TAARDCPVVLAALADGRVHLSGLTLLAAHITPENADELLAAATHKSKREIERVVAERFPKVDLPAQVRSILQPSAAVAALEAGAGLVQTIARTQSEPAPGQVRDPVTQVQARPAEFARVAPLAPQRYGIQFTLDQEGHDLLRQIQDLLGHEVPRG